MLMAQVTHPSDGEATQALATEPAAEVRQVMDFWQERLIDTTQFIHHEALK